MTRDRLRPALLVRRILLPPLLAGLAAVSMLVVLAAGTNQRAKASNPLAGMNLVQQLSSDLEGTPTASDVLRARRPLPERRRLLGAHPYAALYRLARSSFGVPRMLIAAVHYQETGFGKASDKLAHEPAWYRHKDAALALARPDGYPHRSARHPSIRDDFDVVMSIAAELRSAHASDLGESAVRALATRYGTDPAGRLSAAMVIERARAWQVLGTLPLPGRGELATPVEGVVPGCGYFACPRPGHLHNGLDLLAPTGTPIHAADSGDVALLQSIGQSGGYGNFICLQHRPHLATCYAHLSAVAAGMRVGAHVRRGEVIGLVGETGSSSAPHLHFEVRRGPAACQSCAIDPAPLLDGQVPESIVPEMVRVASSAGERATHAVAPRAPAPAPAPVSNAGSSRDATAEHPAPAHALRAPSPDLPPLPPRAPVAIAPSGGAKLPPAATAPGAQAAPAEPAAADPAAGPDAVPAPALESPAPAPG